MNQVKSMARRRTSHELWMHERGTERLRRGGDSTSSGLLKLSRLVRTAGHQR